MKPPKPKFKFTHWKLFLCWLFYVVSVFHRASSWWWRWNFHILDDTKNSQSFNEHESSNHHKLLVLIQISTSDFDTFSSHLMEIPRVYALSTWNTRSQHLHDSSNSQVEWASIEDVKLLFILSKHHLPNFEPHRTLTAAILSSKREWKKKIQIRIESKTSINFNLFSIWWNGEGWIHSHQKISLLNLPFHPPHPQPPYHQPSPTFVQFKIFITIIKQPMERRTDW